MHDRLKINSRGDIAIFLTLLSFSLMVVGALVGTRLIQQGSRIPSQACETQCAICGNNDHGQTVCAGGYYESCGIVTLCNGSSKWCWSRGDRCSGGPAPTNPPPPPPGDGGGCPAGQAWGPCLGVCADSGTQAMFNNTWCDGQGRWLWERAGNNNGCNGNPSQLKSAGPCPGTQPTAPAAPYRSPTPVKTECEMGGGYCEVRNSCQADGVAYVGGLGCTGANVVCCGYTQPSAGPVQCGTNGSYCEIIDTCPANTYVDTSALGCPSRTECCRPRTPPSPPPTTFRCLSDGRSYCSVRNPNGTTTCLSSTWVDPNATGCASGADCCRPGSPPQEPPQNPPGNPSPPAQLPSYNCHEYDGNWQKCIDALVSGKGCSWIGDCQRCATTGTDPAEACNESPKCLDKPDRSCEIRETDCTWAKEGTIINEWCPLDKRVCCGKVDTTLNLTSNVDQMTTGFLSAFQSWIDNYTGATDFSVKVKTSCYVPGLQKQTCDPTKGECQTFYPPCIKQSVGV